MTRSRTMQLILDDIGIFMLVLVTALRRRITVIVAAVLLVFGPALGRAAARPAPQSPSIGARGLPLRSPAHSSPSAQQSPEASAPSTFVPATTTTTTIVTATIVATTSTDAPPTPARVLKLGMRGADVLALKNRLDLLRFDVGSVDDRFDAQTWQGVVAFQKLSGLPRSGKVDRATDSAIASATTPGGLIPNGPAPRVEIDVGRQVLMLFDAYGLRRVLNISSGSEKAYCTISGKTSEKVCGDAKTPRGNFRVQRRIAGWRESDLGKLYNPLYFDGGFAIHGALSVPAYPASHGCVRISMASAEWFPSAVANGTPVYLFD